MAIAVRNTKCIGEWLQRHGYRTKELKRNGVDFNPCRMDEAVTITLTYYLSREELADFPIAELANPCEDSGLIGNT